MEETRPQSPDHRRMTKAELSERLLALQQPSEKNRPSAPRERELQAVLHELEVYQIELEMQVRELRDSRQELEESHDRYVNLYDFAPVGYVTLNEQGTMQEINLTAAKLLGVERHWLLNRALAPWVLPADLPVFRKHLQRCRDSDGKALTTLHLVRREKQIVPVELSSLRVTDAQTEEVAFRTVITDLTDHHAQEQKLAIERHKLEAIFRDSPAAMALLRGEDLIFEMLNSEYQTLFEDRDLLGRPILEAIPELAGQLFHEALLQVLKTGRTYRGHEVPARISGSATNRRELRYFDFSYVRIQTRDRLPYGVYIHAVEVTDRVNARQALEESKEVVQGKVSQLERERELRERFVDALTHDLRTPLTAAKLSAQLLKRINPTPAELQLMATRISDNMSRADQMIRDLLDASRIKAGEKVKLRMEERDVAAVVRSTLDNQRVLFGDRLVFNAPAGPLRARCDSGALARIVDNVVGNAFKYGAPGSPVTVSLKREGAVIELAVHNDGEPIPKREIPELFERFHRTQAAEEGAARGWGIGLTLVKGLAEAHGGSVEVVSTRTAGTTFLIRLPVEGRKKKKKKTG